MKSSVELNSLLSKFFCYYLVCCITWLDATLDDLQTKPLCQILLLPWNNQLSDLKITNCKHRGSRSEVFCKKGVLRNFAKFTIPEKHLCQSLFFKNTRISKSSFSYKTPSVAASLKIATFFFERKISSVPQLNIFYLKKKKNVWCEWFISAFTC